MADYTVVGKNPQGGVIIEQNGVRSTVPPNWVKNNPPSSETKEKMPTESADINKFLAEHGGGVHSTAEGTYIVYSSQQQLIETTLGEKVKLVDAGTKTYQTASGKYYYLQGDTLYPSVKTGSGFQSIASISKPTLTQQIQLTPTDVLRAGPTPQDYSVKYSQYVGEGQWKNVVETSSGMREVITGKGPLSMSAPVIQPFESPFTPKPDIVGKNLVEQAAIGFMSGIVSSIFLPINLPVAAVNLARETSAAGSNLISFKADQYVRNIVNTAVTSPAFLVGSVAGSIAGGKALGEFAGEVKDIVKPPKSITIGMTESQIENIQGNAAYGSTTGRFGTAAGKENIISVSESQFKSIDKGDFSVSIEKGISTTLIERKGLEKLAGESKVYTEIKTPFIGAEISKEVISNTFAEGFKIITPEGLNEGIGLSRRIVEAPGFDIYQTLAKTGTDMSFMKQTVFKIPPSSEFQPTMFGHSTIEISQLGTAAKVIDVAAQIHKSIVETAVSSSKGITIITPVFTPQKELEKQMQIPIPKNIIIEQPKQRQVAISIELPVSLVKQFEGLKNLQNPIQKSFTPQIFKPFEITRQMQPQLTSEVEKAAVLQIQQPKTETITTPREISRAFVKPGEYFPISERGKSSTAKIIVSSSRGPKMLKVSSFALPTASMYSLEKAFSKFGKGSLARGPDVEKVFRNLSRSSGLATEFPAAEFLKGPKSSKRKKHE